MSNKVTIHLKGGGSYETTEIGLPNAQRLMAGKIAGIEREGENDMDLKSSIDESLVMEITENETKVELKVEAIGVPTMDELLGTDKDVLKKMANDIAELKQITKVNGRSGVEKLAEWIFENQSK